MNKKPEVTPDQSETHFELNKAKFAGKSSLIWANKGLTPLSCFQSSRYKLTEVILNSLRRRYALGVYHSINLDIRHPFVETAGRRKGLFSYICATGIWSYMYRLVQFIISSTEIWMLKIFISRSSVLFYILHWFLFIYTIRFVFMKDY